MRLTNFFARSVKRQKVVDKEVSGQIKTVGGHNENFTTQDGFLAKATNRTEARFYQRLMNQPCGMSSFTATCKDVRMDDVKTAPTNVVLEDLRRDFKKPIIYDIKLGTKTVSALELRVTGVKKTHILEKDVRLHLADNVSSSSKRGYRFVGCSERADSRTHLGTHPDEMVDDLRARLTLEDRVFVINELERMHNYFKSKEGKGFELIGASVLIVAESDENVADRSKPKVKLIDFAHSNVVDKSGILLSNGIIHSPKRKHDYQKGLVRGLATLAEDLRK